MARKELFDIPRKLYINEQLSDWADLYCEEKNMSFAAYIRYLMTEHKKQIDDELSQQNQLDNRPNGASLLSYPNGLYSAEQVAKLINAMRIK